MDSYKTPARQYAEGIGVAVADRTINRIKPDGTRETWADVAQRVAQGNALLTPDSFETEYHPLHHHLRQASILLSGRHLQHGDDTQPTKNQEVFTNCCHKSTKLLTIEHGVTTLGDIVDQTVTVRCVDGQWRPATARAYGEQQLFELTFKNMSSGGPKKTRTEKFTAFSDLSSSIAICFIVNPRFRMISSL